MFGLRSSATLEHQKLDQAQFMQQHCSTLKHWVNTGNWTPGFVNSSHKQDCLNEPEYTTAAFNACSGFYPVR